MAQSKASPWQGRDVISMRDIPREQIDEMLSLAQKMEPVAFGRKKLQTLSEKVVAVIILEPSTRTYLSFATAAKRLGGSTVSVIDAKASSINKGETLHDTIKLVDSCVDAIVMRNPVEGSARLAAETAEVPVINAGDGANQHPTQALLDLYTIKKERGKIDKQKVMLIGDLKNGRTVHSLAQALSNYDVELQLYSPPQLRMPSGILRDLEGKIRVQELDSMDLSQADVVYATRIQKERFADPEEYKKYSYVIDAAKMREMKKDAILMHPLPRVDEISTEVDSDPRAKYYQQEANGIPVRMALLQAVIIG
ncbi:MAG: aspartate carbamoyltransferase [Candidatus Micrarchaeia archaeon]|jgi:aspartate carbamoyltransferase catalytic subunit